MGRSAAITELKETIRRAEALTAEDSGDRGITRDLILAHFQLSQVSTQMNQPKDAEEQLRLAREILETAATGSPFTIEQFVDWMGLPDLYPAPPPLPVAHLGTPTPDPTAPHVNGLVMRFVPVPGTQVRFCIWHTRVKDFKTFVRETGYVHMGETTDPNSRMWSLDQDGLKQSGRSWDDPGFVQSDDHPVVGVNWFDAKAFCQWLTARERAVGRLPTDHEWSPAVGLTEEDPAKTPREKDGKIPGRYLWGDDTWPPLPGAGNFAGAELADGHSPDYYAKIPGYNDGFPRTSTVGSFKPNRHGIHDLGGNVFQWCEDDYCPGSANDDPDYGKRVLVELRKRVPLACVISGQRSSRVSD